jgi:hypothetical protein
MDASLGIIAKGSVLGASTTGARKLSLTSAVSDVKDFKDRLLAAVYLTAVQGVALSLPVVATGLGKKEFEQHMQSFNQQTAWSGAVNGLRCAFERTSKSVAERTSAKILIGASGVAMRVRKQLGDAKMGYVNNNPEGDLFAGGATALASVMVQDMHPGVPQAVGKAGVLLSEYVAGRGSLGVYVGTSLEIGVDLVASFGTKSAKLAPIFKFAVAIPIVGPYLQYVAHPTGSVMAGQASAIIQMLIAWHKWNTANGQADEAFAMYNEQRMKTAAIYTVLEHNIDVTKSMNSIELNLVLKTIADPYSVFREKDREMREASKPKDEGPQRIFKEATSLDFLKRAKPERAPGVYCLSGGTLSSACNDYRETMILQTGQGGTVIRTCGVPGDTRSWYCCTGSTGTDTPPPRAWCFYDQFAPNQKPIPIEGKNGR